MVLCFPDVLNNLSTDLTASSQPLFVGFKDDFPPRALAKYITWRPATVVCMCITTPRSRRHPKVG